MIASLRKYTMLLVVSAAVFAGVMLIVITNTYKFLSYIPLLLGFMLDYITIKAGFATAKSEKHVSGLPFVSLLPYFIASLISYKLSGSVFTLSIVQAAIVFMLISIFAFLLPHIPKCLKRYR